MLIAAACDDEAPDRVGGGESGGGSGGVGGGGGGGEEVQAELCQRACSVLVPCDTDAEDGGEGDCVDTCMAAHQPRAPFEECLSCLESVSCEGATLGCRHGPACDMAYDLHVSGTGLTGLEGRTLRILVVEDYEDEHWVDFARQASVVDGAFDVTMAGSLPVWGIPFDVVVLADGDGDGACTEGGADRAWRMKVGVPSQDVDLEVTADTVETPEACSFWEAAPVEIVVEGVGLDQWNGKTVIAAPVWFDDTFLSIGAFASATIQDGSFRTQLGDFGDKVDDMAPDSEVRLAWMVDLDGDWHCTPADAGGSGLVPEVDGLLQRVEAGPTEIGSAPCQLLRGLGYDIHLEGAGYGAFEGMTVEAALLDPRNLAVARSRGKVTSGGISFDFDGAGVSGVSYDVALWIDVDGSKACEVPEDATWRRTIGAVSGDLEHEIPYSEDPADAALCSHFDLTRQP